MKASSQRQNWRTFLPAIVLLSVLATEPARAQRGPCETAAPTTPDVNLFVTDLDRSVAWYREHAGLIESSRSFDFGRGGIVTVRMARGNTGVTLAFSPARSKPSGLQMVCLVLDDSPAGQARAYLADPDGTSVELVAVPAKQH